MCTEIYSEEVYCRAPNQFGGVSSSYFDTCTKTLSLHRFQLDIEFVIILTYLMQTETKIRPHEDYSPLPDLCRDGSFRYGILNIVLIYLYNVLGSVWCFIKHL